MNKPLHDPRARHAPVPGTVVAMSLSPAPAARRLRSLCLAASLTTALAACTTPPPAPPPPPPAPVPVACVPEPVAQAPAEPSAIDTLLAYHQTLKSLNPAELARESANLNAQAKSPELSVRKAMVLSLSRATNDLALAQIHLDTVLSGTDAESTALKPLARLLGTQWSEQRRLADSLDKLNTQAKDNQRKTDQLNEKLEALKAIERTLPASPAAPGPATGASSVKQQGG